MNLTRISTPKANPIALAAIVLVLQINATCSAAERVLDSRMHHLRSGEEREWAEFPEQAEGKAWTFAFTLDRADAPCTLRLRHRDVKQKWRLCLNDHDLGSLPPDYAASIRR